MKPARIEYKYYIPYSVKMNLLEDLSFFARLDTHSNNTSKHYRVSSIYYDTYTLKAYRDKLDGQAKRVKFRLRFYPLLNKEIFGNLELKYKIYDKGFKKKIRIPANYVSLFLDVNNLRYKDFEESSPFMEVVRILKTENIFPVTRVDYERIAFVSNCDTNIRVTLDSNIKCSKFGSIDLSAHLPIFANALSIFEIKTLGNLPFWLTRIIKKYSLKRMAISKYGLSIERLSQFNDLFLKVTRV